MENFIDNMLESIFDGVASHINIIAGILIAIAGTVILAAMKKRPSKGKNIAAWVCVGVGCLGTLSGVIQSLLR